jgi:hypothetical protein
VERGPRPSRSQPGLTPRVGPEGHGSIALHQVRPLEAVFVLEAAMWQLGRGARGPGGQGVASHAVPPDETTERQQQGAEELSSSGLGTKLPGSRHLGFWDAKAGGSGRGAEGCGWPTGRSLIGGTRETPGARGESRLRPLRSRRPPGSEHLWAWPRGAWPGGVCPHAAWVRREMFQVPLRGSLIAREEPADSRHLQGASRDAVRLMEPIQNDQVLEERGPLFSGWFSFCELSRNKA